MKIIFAICKNKDLKKYLKMSNNDIKSDGDRNILEMVKDCQAKKIWLIPYRNRKLKGE